MSDMTFEQTIAAAQSGDEDAFASLWRQLHPPLLRYLRVLAPEHAEDLASDCWLQVVRSLRRFKGDEAGFKSWLFTIARNKVTDARRQARRRPTQSFDEGYDGDEGHDGASGADRQRALDDTEQLALERISTESALRLIGELPPDQAEIIVLRVVAGLEVADVARIVRKSPGAVRVTSHRALRKLQATLTRSGDPAAVAGGGVTQ
jgi:RNA polymerase sigma-70 factor (ECF subfamily)